MPYLSVSICLIQLEISVSSFTSGTALSKQSTDGSKHETKVSYSPHDVPLSLVANSFATISLRGHGNSTILAEATVRRGATPVSKKSILFICACLLAR